MRRRRFLSSMATAGAAVAGLKGRPVLAAPGDNAWGAYPDFALPGLLPPEKRAKNVLEVFLYGGLCPWETFYVVPEYGQPGDPDYANQQWWTFQSGFNDVQSVYEGCHGSSAPPMLSDFAVDENLAQVQMGPFTEPLRSRNDIMERLRIHVISHSLEPHEAAIPYAMSGYRLGQPKLAGVGAAVQHYFQVRDPIVTGEPYAYVLYSPGDFPTDNLRASSAVGQHPGASRPLSIRVSQNTSFIDALNRNTLGGQKAQFDALLNHYRGRYAQRLTFPGAENPVRSQAFADYDFSLSTLQQTDDLVNILEPQFFQGVSGTQCGDTSTNYPHMGLKLGAHLLTRPDSKARYVMVVDGGLIPASGGGGYDTHSSHIADSGRNLANLWAELNAIINEPGEDDPDKLNLDETLIVINTEFGRTPGPQGSTGRNHWPYAYTTLMFGGPVGPDSQGIVGAIGPDGLATSALHPAETRAAILSALGVYPFAPECYAVSDILGASSELEGCMMLNEVVLGVPA